MLGLQENDLNISKVAQWAQTVNHIQDQFFRRAAFAESIDRQLTDVGLDLFQVMKEGKLIPKDVVARAVDDAMKVTMSYMPNSSLGGKMKDPVTGKMVDKLTTIDAGAERAAGWLVQGIEKTPFASLAVPFPRFMANALAFQYRYSPFGFISSPGDFTRMRAATKAGDEATATMLRRQMMEHGAQATIGTAALAAAIDYRRNNQDTDPGSIKNDDGSVTDVRAVFPAAPYLLVADAYVKVSEGVPVDFKALQETILGMKIPAGTQSTILDTVVNAMGSEDAQEAFSVSVGKVFGDFAGRFTQPFVVKQVYDFVDMMNGEDIARDPNVIDLTEGGWEQGFEAATNRVKNKLPIAKESLPAAAPRFEENEVIRKEGEFFNRIVGVRNSYEGSKINQEFRRIGVNPWKSMGTTTGDREIDNLYTRAINKVALPELKMIIEMPDYKEAASDRERRKIIKGALTSIVSKVREEAFKDMPTDQAIRAKYRTISKEDRKRINDEYKRRHGVSLEEAGKYVEAEGVLAELDAAIPKFNKGGFVQRR
jgi:hypothetical protein